MSAQFPSQSGTARPGHRPLVARAADAETQPGPLRRGQLVGGRFLIERKLAESGMGVLYLALDQQLFDRFVVVKLMIHRLFAHPSMKERFFLEAEALALIEHPGVVTVLAMGELPDAQPYLVMQFIPGTSLRACIPPGGMELEILASLLRQIGRALTAVHAQQVLHRDIKPENIMVQRLPAGDLHAKLIDFGLARVAHALSNDPNGSYPPGGTLNYMPPELLMEMPASEASDVFALGIVACEMATGVNPFNASVRPALDQIQALSARHFIRTIRPSFPEKAETLILEALSYDPGRRPRHPAQWTAAIASLLLEAAKRDVVAPSVDPSPSRGLTLPPTPLQPLEDWEGQGEPARQAETTLEPQSVVVLSSSSETDCISAADKLKAGLEEHGHRVTLIPPLGTDLEAARLLKERALASSAFMVILPGKETVDEALLRSLSPVVEHTRLHGRPRLLEIRVGPPATVSPGAHPRCFEQLDAVIWEDRHDAAAIVKRVSRFLLRKPPLEERGMVEPLDAAIPLDNEYYVRRSSDDRFTAAIARRTSIVLVKGASQMGKTSLLARALRDARQAGARVVHVNFEKFDAAELESSESLVKALMSRMAEQLELDLDPNSVWASRLGANQNLEKFMRREVMGRIQGPLVFGMDEVDRLFGTRVGNDLFALFRSWHNDRAIDSTGVWKRLTLAIAYSTEPQLFITNPYQSPFNVGEHVYLDDFTLQEVSDLNARYGSPLRSRDEKEHFMRLLGGQPYLVHHGLFVLFDRQISMIDLETQAVDDRGPFGPHLKRLLLPICCMPEFGNVVASLLSGKGALSPEHFYRLRSAGILRGDSPSSAAFRCQLYERYLRKNSM